MPQQSGPFFFLGVLIGVCVHGPACACVTECEWVDGMFVEVFMAHMCICSEQ